MMRFCEPTSLLEAVSILAEDENARCMAGGATLVAMMNAGVLNIETLVSLRRISSLVGINRRDEGTVTIGAMTPHDVVAASSVLEGGLALIAEAATQIAHPGVRRLGTLGGSLAHADPNSDYPCAVLAAGGHAIVTGPDGEQKQPIDSFFIDVFQTSIGPSQILTAIELPKSLPNECSTYLKFSRVDGDYATVSVAVRLQMNASRCERIRIAIGACGPTPLRLADAEQRLIGTSLDDHDLAAAGETLAANADPVDDNRGSADYRRYLIKTLVSRAVRQAANKLEPVR